MFVLFVALSCAHVDDQRMTAAEHRNEARILAEKAAVERSEYDARVTHMETVHNAFGDPADSWNDVTYNPTASHLDKADSEMREAARHLTAARRLEAFEDARCRAIPPAERSACPLLASAVREVKETKDGVLLELGDGVDATATFLRLDCHLAYAIAEGFARPSCPLFVKGMSITLQLEGGGAIALSSADPATAETIREQARHVFLFDVPVSSR